MFHQSTGIKWLLLCTFQINTFDLVIDLCLKSQAWLSFRLMLLGQVHRWFPCSGAWALSQERHGAEEQHLLVCENREKIFYFCFFVCLNAIPLNQPCCKLFNQTSTWFIIHVSARLIGVGIKLCTIILVSLATPTMLNSHHLDL